jgi:nucleotide-binding universal stress UspA family protein
MSALRSILLHLDASPRSARRLALARELAAQHGAQLTALYASAPTLLSLPLVMAQGMAEMLPMLREIDIAQRDTAKALFDREAANATPPMRWREWRDGRVIHGVAHEALCADLLVLGQHDGTDADATAVGVPPDFIPSVLLASGRPALVVPAIDGATRPASEVLIAWKPTRESAHAVTAAMPLLQRAARIHLALAAPPEDIDEPADDPTDEQAAALEGYLRAHDVRATFERHAPLADASAGEALLSLAADTGADLLVMGCYGHGRAREFVLGGATRTVLQSMTLPVLMAH